MLLVLLVYIGVFAFLPSLTPATALGLHFAHALAWTLFHSAGLGLALRAQSEHKALVRHFLKHYHYPRGDGGRGAVLEAFTNWKAIYNLSMTMTFGAPSVPCALGRALIKRADSVLYLPDVEDILLPTQLDGWGRPPPTHSRCGA
jgi:hypothetical protein